MAIKKGILCQDEAKTQPVYPYTQTDCVFDEDTSMPQENINQSLAGSLATIETSPSTSAHSVGEYIVYNYQLYKVISAISVNDNLVENTNIQKANVGDRLDNIKVLTGSANSGAAAAIALNANVNTYYLMAIFANGYTLVPYVSGVGNWFATVYTANTTDKVTNTNISYTAIVKYR